ncbi:hypothetical protein [uncultured Friedmanniella sp.]|uniref:hypothetical protein n=1 Tax=uncultured Friedmanniella sp. TaxID=335381 RepID=UPI0035CC884F
MSTLTYATSTPSPTANPPAPVPVPFARLALAEGRKLLDTRAGRGVLLAILLVTLGAVTLVLFTTDGTELTWQLLATTAALPQALLLPVLGILTATAEWTHRTGLVTFTLEPRRLRVGAAKLVAVAVVAVLAVGAALALGAVANVVGLLWLDGNGSWAFDGSLLAGGLAFQVLGVAQGLAFGAAIGNSAGAIVALLALPQLWSVLTALVSWLEKVAPWCDLNSAAGPLLSGSLTGVDWARLGTSVAVWILLPLLIGAYRLVHRELS